MSLSPEQKTKLIKSCKLIYEGYAALQFVQEKSCTAGSELKSIESIVSDAIKSNEIDKPIQITMDESEYTLTITSERKGEYKAQFLNYIAQNPAMKECKAYSKSEKISLIVPQKYNVKANGQGKYVFGLEIKSDNNQIITLGGPQKIDLYSEHLSTLYNIQTHLEKDGDISSMLIALATGAGKTFIQALWILVLKQAKMSGIFAVPNALIDQFKEDLKRLLSDELVDEIKTLKENEANDEAIAILPMLDQTPHIIVASYEELLDHHYTTLNALNHVVLSFDEQHLVIEQEKRELQLAELAANHLTMFLTATPNQKTYELCGSKPVAYMSSKQKADANHGLFPKLEQFRAINLDDREQQAADNHINMMDQMLLKSTDSFLEQRTSPILGLFEKFQYDNESYYFNKDKFDNDDNSFHKQRWTYQPPTSRKMLCIIDNNEELINLNNAINKTDEIGDQYQFNVKIVERLAVVGAVANANNNDIVFYKRFDGQWEGIIIYAVEDDVQFSIDPFHDNLQIMQKNVTLKEALDRYSQTKNARDHRIILESVNGLVDSGLNAQSVNLSAYKNGNILARDAIYKLMQQEDRDVDKKIGLNYRKYKTEKNNHTNPIDKVSLAEQLDRNVFSGIVNYLFSDLTGLSLIELNEQRMTNFDDIFLLIDEKIKQVTKRPSEDLYAYFFNKLSTKIDEAGAQELATVIRGILLSYEALLPGGKKHFIENWTLTNTGRDALLTNAEVFNPFTEYTNKHRVLYVMKDMDKAETAIKSDAPFFGFSEEIIRLKNTDGTSHEKAKKREKTALESLNAASTEYHYAPNYADNLTEVIADNYFKLDLVGMYVSNKKTEGFSDLNLHTVINTIPEEADSNNDPAKSIQGLGRLRGKDVTQQPLFFSTSGRHLTPSFDLNLLNKEEDYYPQYFEAKKKYNENSIEFIGENIGTRINEYFIANSNEYDEINYRQYNDAIQLIILDAFREIYNNNSHDLELSKAHLNRALAFATDNLVNQQTKIKVPYQLDSSSAFLGTLIDFAYEITYYFKAKEAKSELNSLAEAYNESDDASPVDMLYAKILQQSDLKLLVGKSSTFIEFTELFKKKAKGIERNIKSHLIQSMSEEDILTCNRNIKENFLPLFAKYINPLKQYVCLREAGQFGEWYNVFIVEHELLSRFENADKHERAKIAVQLFKKVPKLHYYLSDKHDAYSIDNPLLSQLFPVLIKVYKPEAQSRILNALAGFENWDEVFSKVDANTIEQLLNEELSMGQKDILIKEISIELFKATGCFERSYLKENQRSYLKTLESAGESISEKIKDSIKQDAAIKATAALNFVRSKFNVFKNKKKPVEEKPAQQNSPKEGLLATYLAGNFINDIEPLFIQKDLDILSDLFKNKQTVNDFANYLPGKLLASLGNEDQALLLKPLQDFFETYDNGRYNDTVKSIVIAPVLLEQSIDSIQHLSDSIIDFATFIKDKYKDINQDTKEKIIKENIFPIICAPAFKKTILDTVGHFNKEDIEQFIQIVAPSEIVHLDSFFAFISLYKDGQYGEIFNEYIKADAIKNSDQLIEPTNDLDAVNNLTFSNIWSVIIKMQQEQIRCHKHFNRILCDKNDKSLIINDLNVDFFGCGVIEDVGMNFGIFQARAMQNSMGVNSEISAECNEKHAANLRIASEYILRPMLRSLTKKESHTVKNTVFSGAREIKKPLDLIDSSKKLAERINQLTPLTSDEVNQGTRYSDAIDFLIQPIIQNPGLSYLTDWWYQKSQPNHSILRFNEVKNIDKSINHCDVSLNKDLNKIYQLATQYLRNDANYIFSRQYDDVRSLRRVVYSQMMQNLQQNDSKAAGYSDLIDKIKAHLANEKGNNPRFYSSTLNEIEQTLANPNLSDAFKLANVQFIARDYNADLMHGLQRKVSHFFSAPKNDEGLKAKVFCEMLGKANFVGDQQPDQFTPWLNSKQSPVMVCDEPGLTDSSGNIGLNQ